MHAVRKKAFIACISVLVLILIELIVGFVQELIINPGEPIRLLQMVFPSIIAIVFFFITEYVTVVLSKHTAVNPLAESVTALRKLHDDRKLIKKERSADNLYFNHDIACQEKTEPLSRKTSIDFIISDAVKKYIRFKNDEQNGQKFTSSAVIPIADISKSDDLKDLIRCEEIYGYNFGIIYNSAFNKLVVDPIKTTSKEKKFKPYERVIPNGGNGVVMVTRIKDRFIVLRQFRHAPRKEQWSFPRGHGETDIQAIENAKKELEEEIGAISTKEPVFLGRISPDSGLTSSCASVYLVDVDQYSPDMRNEGICEIKAVSDSFFEELLQKNSTGDISTPYDDGFTMAAYMLYKNHMGKCIEKTESEVIM